MTVFDNNPIVCGFLVRKLVDEFLKKRKLDGSIDDFYEHRGIFESHFYCRGEEKKLRNVYKKLKDIFEE